MTDPAPLPSGRHPEDIAKLIAEFTEAIEHPEAHDLTDAEVARLRAARDAMSRPAPPKPDRHTIRRRGHR